MMMIISRAEMLAIVAVVDIAIHGHGRPVSGKDIEKRHGLSRRYLEQKLQGLVGGGILIGERGKLGGYRLARAPHRITVEDIVLTLRAASDDVKRVRSSITKRVVIRALNHAQLELAGSLRRITIHDLALKHIGRPKKESDTE